MPEMVECEWCASLLFACLFVCVCIFPLLGFGVTGGREDKKRYMKKGYMVPYSIENNERAFGVAQKREQKFRCSQTIGVYIGVCVF